jgi:DNA primase
LGYSPEEWTALVDKAQVAGFHPDYLAASGLAIERDDKSLYDRFPWPGHVSDS